MNTNNDQQQNLVNDSEIDIMAIIARLWEKKKFIIKVTCVFTAIGLFFAIFSPKVYTSSCTFVPQTSKKSNSSLSSLAALAGINLGEMSSGGNTLSPLIYPQILDNIDFKKDLMYSKLYFEGYSEPISFIDYYTKPEYSKFNILNFIKQYTVGLPGIIISKVKNMLTSDKKFNNIDDQKNNPLKSFSQEEFNCSIILGNCLSMSLDEKKGYINIVVNLGEPYAAAQLCQITFDLLQKYVTEFKISKAKDQYNFINGRYLETKLLYEEKQKQLAQFMDANMVISTAQARTEQEKLVSEYNMANAIYSELAKQRLQAEIQVKEDTPILTAVRPVSVPFQKTKPKRVQILFLWTFFGVIAASMFIICFDWLVDNGVMSIFFSKIIKKI